MTVDAPQPAHAPVGVAQRLQGLKRLPLATRTVRTGRELRRWYVRRRYPRGGFSRCLGIDVFCDFSDPTSAWYEFDSPNLAFDLRLLRAASRHVDGQVVVDVGAHFGFFAAALSAIFPEALVVAVEPDDRHFRCLEQTATRATGRVVTVNSAVAAEDGTLTLYGGAGACRHSYASPSEQPVQTIAARSLDSLVTEHTPAGAKVGFVKIDVDGAEPQVLLGASETLREHRPILFMEFAPRELSQAGVTPEEFFVAVAERFHVHFVSYRDSSAQVVTRDDFPRVAEAIGDGIGDLLLSPDPIHLDL